ncbi:hypothetical protein D1159_10110 [Pseudoflavonifractor sp. 524-17]|uniref:peptidylprolyl isomerase n=1 Tax=Pseudoflavonifractor sp. 524-17 TaxID=2304577 RepID=UPI00137A9D2A|nr:peptidylprolyl isomerase [Pseudoflavonifractor sp. 524-17]NCE64929.1 hypothetical protein [Pseudoflavonifractor sp. 524-17]
MKKRVFLLFVMAAVLLTACGGPEKGETMGVYHQITGVKPEEVVLVLDGNEISAELYCYWTAFNCSALEYQLNMYHDYGMYQELFQEDGSLNWGAEFPAGSGMTLSQYAKTMAEDTIFFYAAIENLAKTHGVVLSAEDEAVIETERQNMEEALGGPEGFENYLTEMGLSRESLTRVMAVTSLLDGLIELAGQQDSPLYLPEADYPKYLGYTDFLFFAVDADKDQEQARKEAEEIHQQLGQAENPAARFGELAVQYTAEGRAMTDYFYTPGSMPEPFEAAAAQLQPGQLSPVVETESGCYILLGKSLPEGLERQPEQRKTLLENYIVAQAGQYQEEMEVVRKGDLTSLDAGNFYQDYLKYMEDRAVENATAILSGKENGASES